MEQKINLDQLSKQYCENIIVGSNDQIFMLITLVGIHLTLRSAWNDLANYSLDLSPGWLVLSGLLYVLGLLPAAWYWYWLLRSDWMNSSIRGSFGSDSFSWWPHDCREIGWSRPGEKPSHSWVGRA